jgi:hypothetical protein
MILTLMTIFAIAMIIPQASATTPSVIINSPTATTPSTGGWSLTNLAYADSTGTLGNTNSAASNIVGAHQSYSGFGISIPSSATITSVRLRIDAASTGSNLKFEVSNDGGTTFLANSDERTISISGAGTTYYIDITGWTTWTTANLNQLWVKGTHTNAGLVWIDWIAVEVTYSSTTNSPTIAEPLTGGWGTPTGALDDNAGINAATAAYSVVTTAFDPQQYHGYGFIIPPTATINSVRVRLDMGGVQTASIKLEVSIDGGATFLAQNEVATTSSPTVTEFTKYVDITSWNTWTPSNLNNDQIWIKVTRDGFGNTVYLDWIPVEITYTLNTFVVPEYFFGGLAALGACFVGFAVFKKRSAIR